MDILEILCELSENSRGLVFGRVLPEIGSERRCFAIYSTEKQSFARWNITILKYLCKHVDKWVGCVKMTLV